MPTGVELATAWVRLVPSMDGAQAEISKALGGANVEKQAADQGKKTGKAWGAGMAGLVAGVVAPLAAGAISSIQALVGEAVQATDSTQKFQNTLKFAGVKTDVIDNLTKSTQKYADETVYSLTDVRNITAQLASNGVKDYDKLGMAAGNLNAIAGGNAETFKSVGMVLTQTAGQGKLTTENWNQLADAIPGAAGPLMASLKKAGAYTGNFRDAMAKGQITSEEFNKALLELGSKPVAVEAAKSTTTFEGAIGNMQASIVSVISTLLQKLQPAFTVITGVISGFFSALVPVIEFIASSPPILAALATILFLVLLPAIIAATVAVWSFTAALLANPITWIVLAIAALVAVIVLLATNWDAVVKWITDVWSGFISWVTGVIAGFVTWWNGVWAGFGAWIQSVWEGFVNWIKGVWQGFIDWVIRVVQLFMFGWQLIWTQISQVFQDIWTNITTWFTGLWNGIVSWFTGILNGIKGVVSTVINGIKTVWTNIWNGIVDFFHGLWKAEVNWVSTVFGAIRDTIANIIGGISRTWNNIWQGMVDFLGRAFSGIVGVVRGPINGIISLINGAINALNGISVTIPDWVPGLGGQTFGIHIPNIPMLAKGGTITGSGYTIVGENGPELLKLPKGAQVNPNYDDLPDDRGVTFNNYAPLGSTPAQALTDFSNRAKGL